MTTRQSRPHESRYCQPFPIGRPSCDCVDRPQNLFTTTDILCFAIFYSVYIAPDIDWDHARLVSFITRILYYCFLFVFLFLLSIKSDSKRMNREIDCGLVERPPNIDVIHFLLGRTSGVQSLRFIAVYNNSQRPSLISLTSRRPTGLLTSWPHPPPLSRITITSHFLFLLFSQQNYFLEKRKAMECSRFIFFLSS